MSLHYLALTDEQVSRIRAALIAALASQTKPEQSGTVTLRSLQRARLDFDEAAQIAHDNPYPFI